MYIREAHPIDSNWADPTLDVKDPTTIEERRSTATRCAASLNLDVPMAVDGVDDAVALAYNAWPERIYILKPNGRIHYKSGLGPFGFKPLDAEASLAKLLGLKAHAPSDESASGDGDAFVDDGFSGIWRGKGKGAITRGEKAPFRMSLRLGKDGTLAGHAEAGKSRTRLRFQDGTFDREGGKLRADVPQSGRPMTLEATLDGETLEGSLTAADGKTLFQFETKRVKPGRPLVAGIEDARGSWLGTATARDPALSGKEVEVILTYADAESLSGEITIGEQTAEFERGFYRAKTGAFSAVAMTEDGATWRVAMLIEGKNAKGRATMGAVGLVVAFELALHEE